MSAEILRRAASLMRSRAEAAICPCGGPLCNIEFGWFKRGELSARFDGSQGAVPHVLHWSPAVALAVADWLDDVAGLADWRDAHAIGHGGALIRPLAVARAYLNEATS